MASTYTPLGIELQATGENAGTWGTKTNTNLQVIEQIAGGFTQQALTSGGTVDLAVSDGSTGATLAHRAIEFTGSLSGNAVVTIPLDVQNFYLLRNSSSGAYTVQFKYVTGSGSSVTFSSTDKGDKLIVAKADDGTNPNIVEIALGLTEISEDTTPQLGGNLDTNSHNILIDDAHFIGDESGNEQIIFQTTGSAVNQIDITNAATGNAPEISATGDDTNIDLKLTPKGSGNLTLDGIKFPNADGSANQALITNGSGTLSFGAAGASWQAVKTANFTAVAGEGYFADTTSSAFTATLPSSASIGNEISFIDYAGTFDSNNLTIGRNSHNIQGAASDLVVNTERAAFTLVYVDSTQGWLLKNN
jgi:hypothetical protein